MKKLKNFSKIDIFKSIFLFFTVAMIILIMLNTQIFEFWYNGFSSLKSCGLKVYYLDVGQATASLVVFENGQTMLIDTGSRDSEKQFLDDVNLILWKNKLSKIDYLVLTHSDEDHVGGAVGLLKKYQVDKIYRPKILAASPLEIETENTYYLATTNVYAQTITSVYTEPNCDVEFIENSLFSIGEADVRFYACDEDYYNDVNSYCPFITIKNDGYTFMFTGDATQTRENELLNYLQISGEYLHVDFLNVAHHGSKYSSTAAFLNKISPNFAFISAGDQKHPSSETIERLKDAFVENIYVSKQVGTCAVGTKDDGFVVCTTSKQFDLPFVCVLLACVCFAVLNFDERSYKKHKNRSNFLKYSLIYKNV